MLRILRLIAWISLLVVCCFGVVSTARAIEPGGESHPLLPPGLEERKQALPMLSDQSSPGIERQPSSTDYHPYFGPWFNMVYESYNAYNGNWILYRLSGENPSPVLITGTDTSSREPAISHDVSRVVYVNNQRAPADDNNDYNLWMRNFDGTNLQRLNDTPGNEGSPMWSPDDSWIVYDYYRSDRQDYDIFLIKPDGSGMVNLTNSPSVDEYYPSFSPDGTKILYSRYGDGISAIWQMNVDGSNAHAITGNLPYLGMARYSVHGYQIAFDSDIDMDGFQEIHTMNPDGTNIKEEVDVWSDYQTYSTYGDETYFTGWYGDVGLIYTFYDYCGGTDNTLYICNMTTKIMDIRGGSTLISGNYSRSAYSQSSDTSISTITAPLLKRYYKIGESIDCFRVTPGGMARLMLREYAYYHDGEYLRSSTDPIDDSFTECLYQPPSGYVGTAQIRIRVWDIAGNMSDWVEISPYTVYKKDFYLQILDNRNTPFQGANIDVGTYWELTNSIITDLSGVTYLPFPEDSAVLYGADVPGYSMDWVKYGLTIISTIINGYRYEFNGFPGDNQFNNSSFVLEQLSLWSPDDSELPIQVTYSASPYSTLHLIMGYGQLPTQSIPDAPNETRRASVEQTVTIPETMRNPTLNFMHWLKDPDGAGSPNRFVVEVIDDQQNVTSIFESGPVSDWQRSWVDMSAWKNQTITVRFSLVETQAAPAPLLSLDNITLGSWINPVIANLSEADFEYGQSFSITVHGNNFDEGITGACDDVEALSVDWIDETQVQVHFNDQVPLGRCTLWLENPNGLKAGSVITVGNISYLPFSIRMP